MKVNISTRLKKETILSLKQIAKTRHESVSSLLVMGMQETINGLLDIKKELAPEKVGTSLSAPVETMMAFKTWVEEHGIPMDSAMDQIAEALVHKLSDTGKMHGKT